MTKLETKLIELKDDVESKLESIIERVNSLEQKYSYISSKQSQQLVSEDEAMKSRIKLFESQVKSSIKTIEDKIASIDLEISRFYTDLDKSVKQIKDESTKLNNIRLEKLEEAIKLLISEGSIESKLNAINEDFNKEFEKNNSIIHNMLGLVNKEFEVVYNRIDNEVKEREFSSTTLVNSLEELMARIKAEFSKIKCEKSEFEENVFTLLEEIYDKLLSFYHK